MPILSDFKPDDAHTIINHSDSVMLIVDKQIMETLSEAEMKSVKAILSMGDFDILSSKPAAKFLTAYEALQKIHLHDTEFEKTPKRSIKRFLYKLEE